MIASWTKLIWRWEKWKYRKHTALLNIFGLVTLSVLMKVFQIRLIFFHQHTALLNSSGLGDALSKRSLWSCITISFKYNHQSTDKLNMHNHFDFLWLSALNCLCFDEISSNRFDFSPPLSFLFVCDFFTLSCQCLSVC